MSAHVFRFLLVAFLFGSVSFAEPPEAPISKSLAIQDALRRGRELLQSGQSLEAVALLEEQLPFINGNVQFLGLLREAYGEAIKKLQLEHKEDQSADFQKRAQILQPRRTTGHRPGCPAGFGRMSHRSMQSRWVGGRIARGRR